MACCLVETSCDQNCQHSFDFSEESENLIEEEAEMKQDYRKYMKNHFDEKNYGDVSYNPHSINTSVYSTSEGCSIENHGMEIINTKNESQKVTEVEERRVEITAEVSLITRDMPEKEIILKAEKLNHNPYQQIQKCN